MISAILLAAGRSSRFPGNKLLVPLRGQPVVVHSLQSLLASPVDEVLVVIGHEAALMREVLAGFPCRLVLNPDYNEGMSGSIRAGLAAAHPQSDALLVCLGDMPLLRPPVIHALHNAHLKYRDCIIAPSAAGRQANPVILPRAYWQEVLALRGDIGCKEILQRHSQDVRYVSIPFVGVLQDADTLEELEHLRRRLEQPLAGLKVLIRGAGEMASGVAHRLARAHMKVCLTELPQPMAIRRKVCFSEAVYEGASTVEDVTARHIGSMAEIAECWRQGEIPLLVDPDASIRDVLQPDVLVDGVMAKRNLGTGLADAPMVIGLGPGFHAGRDVHLVIETNRGHRLGAVVESGSAEPDTGKPGDILGYNTERVLKAPHPGLFTTEMEIGTHVHAGRGVGHVGGTPVQSQISGIVRGLLRSGMPVEAGTKLADVDPRDQPFYCNTISDKARTISGGVLEAILLFYSL